MLTHQEIEAIIEQFRRVDYQDFHLLRATPKAYKQFAWLLTNGIMYLYQGERDIQFGIEVGLFFEPSDHKNPIQELKFEP
jgi:hypothetical protein